MKAGKIMEILRQLPYYTRENLALALDKKGENLNYWIKKLVGEKLLIPIKNGMYISDLYPKSEIYWEQIANVARCPSYISLEYTLAKYGLIPEQPVAITSITLKSPREYFTPSLKLIYRNIKPELFGDYQFEPVKMAYPYKAMFDYLYLRPIGKENRINWEALDMRNRQEFLRICGESGSVKMKKIAAKLL
jgi:hypothetical protein